MCFRRTGGVGGQESDYYHTDRDGKLCGPVGAGLVASLAQPGGNVTGLSNLAVELNTKRLEVLKDAVPKLARVGLLRATTSDAAVSDQLQMKEVRVAAVALKLKLEEIKH